jgi:valyl-tRNA synthetase
MPHDLPKAYDPSAIEPRWAEYWVAEKLFSLPTPDSSTDVFDLLLPPPNVTGRLHMGHMLNQTEMDIIIRWKRMSGCKTLWLPGTDHAGIATQMMVERQLATEGKKRQDLGREKFIERVWDWREHYGGAILDQMKRLGASVDWSREYFTMDENLSRAVREAFVRLHEKGLIYRGKYIVNWCPRCMTAISDLEVVHEEVAGKLYEIRYPVVGTDGFILVATTRPETMLGDTAVAVNPSDKRYKTFIGQKVMLPLMNREIPIVADDWANPEFGTGAVKVTPAHDPNDFAIGQRHNLEQITIMDESARMNENAGPYAGLDRFAAREKVLADLDALGLLGSVKDHTLSIGKCDRCKTVVEPRLSTQWFLKVEGKIAQRAIEVVKRDYIEITPENYKTIYLNWMENIHDWCISRQLWWGHRIPAWHCADCKQPTVARETPKQCVHCSSAKLEQDTDVLDTWFSSGLLPFTVFGWPEKTKDLEVFYPTTLLITGFDILFFWVARMIMLGTWFMGAEDELDQLPEDLREKKLRDSVPFRNVYIHALVRDAERQKMSKTKGNVLDPIEITEKYGTDAVRFTLASMASPGTDIAFSESRTESYRAFANKIWNASRFIFMNVDRAQESGAWSLKDFDANAAPVPTTLEDKWILSRFNNAVVQIEAALSEYRFHEAAHVVYHFFWGEFCDWYIEIVKLRLNAGESQADKSTTATALKFLLYVFEGALRLLSPFMPFITEEIWHVIYEGQAPAKSIALTRFPQQHPAWTNAEAEMEMVLLQALIVDIRTLRAELKVEPKQKVPIQIHAKASVQKLIENNRRFTERLANIEGISFVDEPLSNASGARVAPNYEVRVIFEQKIDAATERERLTKELKKLETEMVNAQRNLGNEQFLAKAPATVVDGIRRREAELAILIQKSRGALAELG